MTLLSLIITFWLIMDSAGNLSQITHLLHGVETTRRQRVFWREMFFALGIMVIFYFFGALLLDALDVSASTVQTSGGLILFLIAIKMIFPSEDKLVHATSGEPYIVPIAMPMLAGPSILATIMLYADEEASQLVVLMAIVIAWILTVLTLWAGFRWHGKINQKFLLAIERLMGLILTLMAVEMFLQGIRLHMNS